MTQLSNNLIFMNRLIDAQKTPKSIALVSATGAIFFSSLCDRGVKFPVWVQGQTPSRLWCIAVIANHEFQDKVKIYYKLYPLVKV